MKIVSIAVKPAGTESKPENHFARVPVNEAVLIAGRGIAGDQKANGSERQLNIMTRETLDQLQAEGCKTDPGEMGEQIVIAGLELVDLPAGSRVRFGPEAIIEVVKPRTGCSRFQHIQGKSPKDVRLRLGVMCRVVTGGPIRIGDAVTRDERG